jgi:hypothetical protein
MTMEYDIAPFGADAYRLNEPNALLLPSIIFKSLLNYIHYYTYLLSII